MRTEKAYYDVPIKKEYAAEILEIRPVNAAIAAIILDRTIFYPEGGGQSSDRGNINGIALLHVEEKDGEILHIIQAEDANTLTKGSAALWLDTKRRRDLTVQHTGQHLLSATILKIAEGHTVSMHIGEETCTIDIKAKELSKEMLYSIEENIFSAIEENLPVITHLCPPENIENFPLRRKPSKTAEEMRVVEIAGKDFSACCGTHLESTGQIGILRILGTEKYKGMFRLYFIAGRRVLENSRLLHRNAGIVSQTLKAPVSETGSAAVAFLEKTQNTERLLKEVEEENALFKARELLRETGTPLVISLQNADINAMLRIGRTAQKLTDEIILLASPKDNKFAAFCRLPDVDLRMSIKETMETHGGKGGGSATFFQGAFPSSKAMTDFLEAFAVSVNAQISFKVQI